MSILKYIFIKNYRQDKMQQFSTALVHKINKADEDLESIYIDIFGKLRKEA